MFNLGRGIDLIAFLFIHALANHESGMPWIEGGVDLYRTHVLNESLNHQLKEASLAVLNVYFTTAMRSTSLGKDIKECLKTAIEEIIPNQGVGIFTQISKWPNTEIKHRDVRFSPYIHKEHPYVCNTLAFLELLCKSRTFLNKINVCRGQALNGTAIDFLIKFINYSIRFHQNPAFSQAFECFFKTVVFILVTKATKSITYDYSNPENPDKVLSYEFFSEIFTVPIENFSFSMRYWSENYVKHHELVIKDRDFSIFEFSYDRIRSRKYSIELFLVHTSIKTSTLEEIQWPMICLKHTKRYMLKGCHFLDPRSKDNFLIDIYSRKKKGKPK